MKLNIKNNKFYYLSIFLIFVLGCVLRCFFYLDVHSLWHDETSLGINIIYGNFLNLWQPLLHVQSAPPFFMTFSKIIFSVNQKHPELTLRFIPFVSGIVGIILFYKLSIKLLKQKSCIIFSNLIFSINLPLIYYSSEFKQYSTDVLIIIASLLYFEHHRFEFLSVKQKIIMSVIMLILPFISLSAVFVIAAYVLLSAYKSNKKVFFNLFLVTLPCLFALSVYYFLTLNPAKTAMLGTYHDLWANGFLELNFLSILNLLKINLNYYFQPCTYILIPTILIFLGIFFLLKRKEFIDKLFLLTIFNSLFASFLHIYPIKERVSLYLIPLIIILIFIPITQSLIKKKLMLNIIFLCFILIFFSGYISNCDKLFKNNVLFKNEYPKELMHILKSKYSNGDIVMYNDASDSEFYFYSKIYDFDTQNIKIGKIQLASYGENWYSSVLNSLPKNNRYWFYYPFDYPSKPVIQFLKNWARQPNNKIIYEKQKGRSYLLLLEN